MDKKAVGKRVKALRTKQKLSQEKFAESVGITRSGLSQMESGAISPSIDLLSRIVEKYSVTFDELLSDATHPTQENKGIPLYEIAAAAGPITMFDDLSEYVADYLLLPGIESNDYDFAVKVWGPSMQGVFNDGDIALCKEVRDRDLINYGAPYFIITSEFKTIKYLHKSNREGYVKLRSENEMYDTFEIPMKSIYKIYHAKVGVSISIKRMSN